MVSILSLTKLVEYNAIGSINHFHFILLIDLILPMNCEIINKVLKQNKQRLSVFTKWIGIRATKGNFINLSQSMMVA